MNPPAIRSKANSFVSHLTIIFSGLSPAGRVSAGRAATWLAFPDALFGPFPAINSPRLLPFQP